MSKHIGPQGPLDAKIVFVGEAPGREEENSGLPFQGASGRLLNQMCEKVGINRNECYVTNVVKFRPPNNDFSTLYTDSDQRNPSELLLKSYAELHLELSKLKPNVIVPLGGEALKAIAGYRAGGITKWRGSIIETQFGKVCGTFHPAYIFRQYGDIPIFEIDLRRIRREGCFPEIRSPKKQYFIEPSFEDAIRYLRRRPKRLAFDIETTFGSLVRCIAFSSGNYEAMSIPFMFNPFQMGKRSKSSVGMIPVSDMSTIESYWTMEEEYEILREMDLLFRDESVQKIAQNAPFDTIVLAEEFGFDYKNLWMDTMVAAHTCYPELPKGLDFLASIYTELPYYSGYDASNDRQTWVYNCDDAVATIETANSLESELEELGLTEYYHNQVHSSTYAYACTQTRGIKIDSIERAKQDKAYSGAIVELKTKLQTLVGDPEFNPKSTQQMQKFLYGKLGLKEQRHHKKKNITTDKNAMEKLEKLYPEQSQLFVDIAEYRSLTTVYSGFYALQLPKGRLFTGYNTAGTVTTRLASSEIFTHPEDSTNLQNIKKFNPKKPETTSTRRCFIADDGFVLIKADLSQAEFRLVVWFAEIRRLIKVYQDNPNFDVHRWVASLIYKKAENLISKDERDIAKNGVYGGNYKMHYVTAARTYKLALDLAKWVLDSYRREIPEIPLWWERVQEELASTRVLTNPIGTRRQFFGRFDDEMLRSAISYLPQSTVGQLINRAAHLADDIMDPKICHILLQVHDELLFQCRDEPRYLNHYVPMVKNLMEYPLKFEGIEEQLVIPADIGIGRNWLDAKTELHKYLETA